MLIGPLLFRLQMSQVVVVVQQKHSTLIFG